MRATSAVLVSLMPVLAQDWTGGLALFREGKYAAAKSLLEAAAPSPMRDSFLGLTLVATNRCDVAEPYLTAHYEAADLRRLTALALVQCRVATGRLNDARAMLDNLTAKYPSDADVLYLSARVAIREFNTATEKLYTAQPGSYRVNQLSGEILELQGKFSEAAAEYRKAIEKNPAAINLHYRLGRMLVLESRLDEARPEFEAELKLNPNDALAEYQVAQIFEVQGKPAQALAHFNRALALQPDFVEALVAKAKLAPDEAIPLLEKAIALAPANERARYALMLAYRNAGRTEDAARQKLEIDKLRKPEGEFSDFLRRLNTPPKP